MEFTYTLDTIDEAARKILAFAKAKILLLEAPMGAGKTTLITALCKELGVTESISSPTFSIVNEYKAPQCDVLHFDLYRFEAEEELIAIGFEDYIYRPNTYVFIEWPEISLKFLDSYHFIRIFPVSDNIRRVEIDKKL